MTAENFSLTRLSPKRASNAFTSHNRGSRRETFDITAEIVAFLRPDEDLADCLCP